jgi:hypothetical protein
MGDDGPGCDRVGTDADRAVGGGEVDALLELDVELERLSADERFPNDADRGRIESWSVAAHLTAWRT